MLFRAVGPLRPGAVSTSQIGLAHSRDWVHFRVHPQPLLVPDPPHAPLSGLEDPRATRLEAGQVVVVCTAYDGRVTRIVCAVGPELWRLGPLRPAFAADEWIEVPGHPRGWMKAGVVLPQPVDHQHVMLWGDTNVYMARSADADLVRWRLDPRTVLSPRVVMWDGHLVEPGPTPILRPEGIHLIYNAAARLPGGALRYAVGQALLSRHDPRHVLWRATTPLLTPAHPAAVNGRVPNVVFAEGLALRGNHAYLYYGMGDRCIGLAVINGYPAPPDGHARIGRLVPEAAPAACQPTPEDSGGQPSMMVGRDGRCPAPPAAPTAVPPPPPPRPDEPRPTR